MDRRITRDHPRVLDSDVPAGEIGDHSARLANQQRPCRDIPGRQALLPESVEPARLPRRPGRARPRRAGGSRWSPGPPGRTGCWYSSSRETSLKGKPVPIRANSGIGDGRDAQASIAEPGAATAGGGVGSRSGAPGARPPPASTPSTRRGNRYGIAGEAMQEVGGPVERVHNPDQAIRHESQGSAPRPPSGRPAPPPAGYLRSSVPPSGPPRSRSRGCP